MGLFDRLEGIWDNLRALAAQWRLLAAFAVLIAFGAVYVERKFFPAAPPPAVPVAKAPGRLAPGEAPKVQEEKATPPADADAAAQSDVASQTLEVAARPVVVTKGQAGWDDATKTLAEALAKVAAAAAKAGLSPNGRPLAVFTETDDKGFKFEGMVPIAKAPEGKPKLDAGLEIGASPAGKALKFQHRGPYADIDATYEAITAYLDEKNLDTKNLFVEEYLTDMEKGDDEKTEVDIYVFIK